LSRRDLLIDSTTQLDSTPNENTFFAQQISGKSCGVFSHSNLYTKHAQLHARKSEEGDLLNKA